jgi:hypothetical protein
MLRNIVLGFNLLALVCAIVTALQVFGVSIALIIGFVLTSDLYLSLTISLFFIAINITIAQGLKRWKKWAYIIGAIELGSILIGLILLIINEGTIGNVFWLIIAMSFAIGLKRDFDLRLNMQLDRLTNF